MIVGKPAGEGLGVSYLHWIIGDANRSIVVEQMADGLHVHNDPVDVLANQPAFDWHMENLRTYITANNGFPQAAVWGKAELKPFGAGAGMRGIPGRLLFALAFCQDGLPQCELPDKRRYGGQHRSHVPYAGKCVDGRGRCRHG